MPHKNPTTAIQDAIRSWDRKPSGMKILKLLDGVKEECAMRHVKEAIMICRRQPSAMAEWARADDRQETNSGGWTIVMV
jgi:hypothetical protein